MGIARSLGRVVLLGAVLLAGARADSFSYSDFSSTSGLTLTGAASQYGDVLRLTPDVIYDEGSAWYSQQQQVAGGFSTTFQFRITHGSGTYADGMWFYVQNDSLAIGSASPTDSLAVEFDDFQNVWDPNANHVAFLSCGSNPNPPLLTDHTDGCTLGINANLPVNFSDGSVQTATVDYTPGSLSLYLNGSPVLQSSVQLGTLLDLNGGNAWVGFHTTTGAYSENNDVLSWSFQEPAPVPEPPAFVLLGTGLLLLAGGVLGWGKREGALAHIAGRRRKTGESA